MLSGIESSEERGSTCSSCSSKLSGVAKRQSSSVHGCLSSNSVQHTSNSNRSIQAITAHTKPLASPCRGRRATSTSASTFPSTRWHGSTMSASPSPEEVELDAVASRTVWSVILHVSRLSSRSAPTVESMELARAGRCFTVLETH